MGLTKKKYIYYRDIEGLKLSDTTNRELIYIFSPSQQNSVGKGVFLEKFYIESLQQKLVYYQEYFDLTIARTKTSLTFDKVHIKNVHTNEDVYDLKELKETHKKLPNFEWPTKKDSI